MRQSTTRHRCPHCDTMLHSVEKLAGRSMDCPNCDGKLTVPRPQSLIPVPRPAAVPEVIDDWEHQRKLAGRKKRRERDTTPVEVVFPGGIGTVKGEVDRKTGNTLISTIFGGFLVAIGVFLCSIILGGKSKSS